MAGKCRLCRPGRGRNLCACGSRAPRPASRGGAGREAMRQGARETSRPVRTVRRAAAGVVLQAEAAECGLACIAMICRHHGRRIGLRELRRRFPLSLKGSSLPDLMRIAAALGFRPRALRVELGELGKLALRSEEHTSELQSRENLV